MTADDTLTPEAKNFAHLLAIAVVQSAHKRATQPARAKRASTKAKQQKRASATAVAMTRQPKTT